nr:glycosyltransferase family 4 protein [Actinomycetota bacterium]
QRLEPGVLVLTRPVLNVVGARLTPPGVRTVGQEHMNFSLHPRTMHAWMLAAYRELDVLTVLTEGDRRDYEDALAGSPVDVVKVPNGLPRLPTVVSDQTAKVIVAAGRLTRQKGFDLLIPAFARVAAEHPDWELRIFGDGAQQPLLQRQIDDLGLSGSVRLMGRTASMAEEMARASIYALSSRFEGFGMVIIEAMSVGLPVVSFDCPRGPSDIITPGSDGLLVPAEDVDALAEGLATLIRDPELRRSMSVTARRTAQNYSMDELGALWKELLRTLGTAVPAHVA